jgi:hypothetical protein
MLLMKNGVIAMRQVRRKKKGELKNDGKSHDVYENKGRANGQIGKSHDVDENKWFIFWRPRCL